MAILAPITEKLLDKLKKTERPQRLGHNTHLVKTEHGHGVRYHRTVVVEFIKTVNGSVIVLDTGNWKTTTTKQRINAYIPGYIRQKSFEWFLSLYGEEVPFFDGMILSL